MERVRPPDVPSALLAAILLLLVLPGTNKAGELVEITGELELTSWHRQDAAGRPVENRRIHKTRCVVGTNTWLIESDFVQNAHETWWFIGTNIAKHTVITSELPEQEKKRIIASGRGLLTIFPEVGERHTMILDSTDGRPVGNLGVNIPWLAFCSGTYLKREGRQIPLPGAVADQDAFGFSDKTNVFDDDFGLPQRAEFYTSDKYLKCVYEVRQSTNILGRTFPLHFDLIQYGHARSRTLEPRFSVSGKVTSMRIVAEAQIPPEAVTNGKP